MTDAEKVRFDRTVYEVLRDEREAGTSIGTYKEKRMHVTLKRFVEPDMSKHEIKVGPYVADILRGDEIVEIQTGSFYPMKEKIAYYLENTDYRVTVVKPLPYIKWCVWIDPSSGEMSKRKKSPLKTEAKHIMRDWLFLGDFLGNERLTIRFLLLETEEFRFLDGWSRDKKRGSSRYELMPLSLIDDDTYSVKDDYKKILPDTLGESFDAAEYGKAMKIRSTFTYYAGIKILCLVGLLRKGEKKGRSYIYTRCAKKTDES